MCVHWFLFPLAVFGCDTSVNNLNCHTLYYLVVLKFLTVLMIIS